MITLVSNTGGIPLIYTTLSFVICISMVKDFFENYKRKKSDKIENNREVETLVGDEFTT